MPTTTLTFEKVRKFFHLPSREAAVQLGIGTSSLKKICRRNGIHRWPFRKYRSITQLVSSLSTSSAELAKCSGSVHPYGKPLSVTCPTFPIERRSPGRGPRDNSPAASTSSDSVRGSPRRSETPVSGSRWKYQTQELFPVTLPREVETMTTAVAAVSLPNYTPCWEPAATPLKYDLIESYNSSFSTNFEEKLVLPPHSASESTIHAAQTLQDSKTSTSSTYSLSVTSHTPTTPWPSPTPTSHTPSWIFQRNPFGPTPSPVTPEGINVFAAPLPPTNTQVLRPPNFARSSSSRRYPANPQRVPMVKPGVNYFSIGKEM